MHRGSSRRLFRRCRVGGRSSAFFVQSIPIGGGGANSNKSNARKPRAASAARCRTPPPRHMYAAPAQRLAADHSAGEAPAPRDRDDREDSPGAGFRGAKRRQVKKACAHCRKGHRCCEEQRPCKRCKARHRPCGRRVHFFSPPNSARDFRAMMGSPKNPASSCIRLNFLLVHRRCMGREAWLALRLYVTLLCRST